jgi:cytochrome c-type biogenesis protein
VADLFAWLSHAVEGAPLVALSAALSWGVLSVVLSPCHLSSIPLVVAFVNGQGRVTTARAFRVSLVFSAGILATIAVIGLLTAAGGRMAGDLGRAGDIAVSGVFILVGLYFLDVIRIPFSGLSRIGTKRRGLAAALLLGLVFGAALGPCTFAYMAPMLAIAVRTAGTNPAYGVALLLFYGVGHCAVIALAGTFAGVVQRYLDWNERSRGAVVLRRVCGGLVIAAGTYLLVGAL